MNKVEKQLSMIIDLKLWHIYPHMCPHICKNTHMCAHVHACAHIHMKNKRKDSSPESLAHTVRSDFEG